MTIESTPQSTALSKAFSKLLTEYLSVEQLEEIRAKNATAEYGEGVCASHDYLDANEVMSEAFTAVVGHEIDVQSESDIELWNQRTNIKK